jgi:hypothetical protein
MEESTNTFIHDIRSMLQNAVDSPDFPFLRLWKEMLYPSAQSKIPPFISKEESDVLTEKMSDEVTANSESLPLHKKTLERLLISVVDSHSNPKYTYDRHDIHDGHDIPIRSEQIEDYSDVFRPIIDANCRCSPCPTKSQDDTDPEISILDDE